MDLHRAFSSDMLDADLMFPWQLGEHLHVGKMCLGTPLDPLSQGSHFAKIICDLVAPVCLKSYK